MHNSSDELCEHGTVWERDGTTVTDWSKCPRDAVGRYRIRGEAGQAHEFWLCEQHREEYGDAILEEVENIE